MSERHDEVRDVVKKRYGSLAELSVAASQASCCGSAEANASCCPTVALYDASLLDGLPADVTGLSLGCGDPVTLADLRPGETVLDLGSGGGIDCFLAARQVGPTGRVIGVDMTPQMIARAEANKARLGVENVEFRLGTIEKLPVEDSSIDIIMSNCVINLSPDKPAVFREAFRVLKPAGRVSISDVVTEGTFSPELQARFDQWADCVTGAIDADRYTTLMREAGFVDVQVLDRVEAGDILPRQPGMPRVFSARIVGRKPAG